MTDRADRRAEPRPRGADSGSGAPRLRPADAGWKAHTDLLWRQSGPLLTIAVVVAIQLLAQTSLRIPNPPAILLLLVVYSGFSGGLGSGLASAGIAWVYIAYFFSIPGQPFKHTDENVRRVAVWAITTPAMALMVGLLKRRSVRVSQDALRREQEYSTSLARSLTTQKELEQQLQRQNEELQEQYRHVHEANRLKSEFLANMSHELRTPLNAIIGFAELMHDGKVGGVSAEHQEYLGDILSSSRHLLQLINDVLDLSKVESGTMEFRPQPVELAKPVGEVREILRALAATKRIRLDAVCDPAVGQVVVDPSKLKQVLYNYLSNALKFTPAEGRVTIRVLPEGADHFRVEVEDTGVGIRPEDVGRLFVEFQQLDSGMTKQHAGTGLGLALTKRIVEAQAGRVGVDSTPGRGSVFFAVLPRDARPVRAPTVDAPSAPAGRPPTGERTLLIIEDDPTDREWLMRTLRGAGYAVESAATGAEAVARAHDRAFDAITLDVILPDMTGRDVLAAIRAAGPNPNIPVIVVTVVAEKEAVAGFPIQDFLVKPAQAAELLASLERAGVPPDGARPVLVVDDDPGALKFMNVTLTRLGYRAVCAAGGAAGLRAAQAESPAAIVLDLLMPEMDGFQFLERYRHTAAGRGTPVIVWTVKDLTADDRARLEGMAQRIVAKRHGGTAPLLDALHEVLGATRTSPPGA